MERDIPKCEDIFCFPLETLEEFGECASKEVGHYPAETMEMFSIPEHSSIMEQIEARTLDHTHILNNLHMQCTQHCLSYCCKEAFPAVCKKRPGILSHLVVSDHVNPQWAAFAEKVFSKPVEIVMRKEGFHESANFVQLVWNWHLACDKQGIRSIHRIRALFEMHTFLTAGMNFDEFQTDIGCYRKDLTVQNFEALLQNISTGIHLYGLSKKGTYYHHGISTWANKSFFSDLPMMDKEALDTPKAANIPKLMRKVMQVNYYKHNPTG